MFKPTGVHALIRRTHEERVLRALSEHGSLSRSEISDYVGLSRTTLSEITTVLLERGAIVVAAVDSSERAGRGRPAARLAIDPGAGQLMGIDFGRRRVHVAVADASHEIIASGARGYDADSTWPERIRSAHDLLDQLSHDTGTHYGALQGVSIGYPGPLAPNLPKADAASKDITPGELVRSSFSRRFGAPVLIDNNSRFAGLAEAIWGDGADTENLVYVRLSDGIGGGLVVGGRLVTGSGGFAGELGHVSVQSNGLQCRCGKRGCLETIASVPSILAGCQVKGVAIGSLEELRAAVAKADPIVDGVLRDAGDALGRVLGTVAVTLNPSQIVIGGEIVQIAPVILQQAIATITYELQPVPETAPTIRAAALGDDVGALGAIAAMFHQSPLLERYPDTALGEPELPHQFSTNPSAVNKRAVNQ
ncbi:ROK family transcriptional regulator [Cryobacterium sp. N19]|uniref:ROK family transcriptional regulator n=1 Tax=Cryobacterium sp. N19 TaxID=2048288 RepID=UPI000CE37492|nr:ROK family protein [Cryobacterium sp. N19]